MDRPYADLADAAERAATVAQDPPEEAFVVHVGAAPVELAMALGLRAIQLHPRPPATAEPAPPPVDGLDLGWRNRSLLEQLVELGRRPTAVLLSGPGRDHAQLYAVLRELDRSRAVALPPCRYVDLPTLPHRTTALYRRRRVREAADWLRGIVDAPLDEGAIEAAIDATARRHAAWLDLERVRQRRDATITGAAATTARVAGAWLRPHEHADLLDRLVAERAGSAPSRAPDARRVLLVGRDLPPEVVDALEGPDRIVAGPDLPTAWPPRSASAALDWLADRVAHAWGLTSHTQPADEVADRVLAQARHLDVDRVLHVAWSDDEAARWDATRIRARFTTDGVDIETACLPDADLDTVLESGASRTHEHSARPGNPDVTTGPGAPTTSRRDTPRRDDRPSRKVLSATTDFGRHQREWFAEVAARARDGEPFAVVNADFPHELLRALGIPYVVNQWWASIAGAKRLTPRFLDALQDHGFASAVEPYSTQGLASTFVPDDEQPWGGLPRPTILGAVAGTGPTAKIFTSWSAATGAELLMLERSVESRWTVPLHWWEELPNRWGDVLEEARLDLIRDELVGIVRILERTTGRSFDEGRFRRVLAHANEQAELSRQVRTLIAEARPAPAGVVDLMPATMIPQWHRGTRWAVDAARRVRDEVAERVAAGVGVAPDERLRLMWVGRGFWGNTALYQDLEETHGAVFVWSMYLGLAADGYLRHMRAGDDPLRALGSRFVTMGDELRMPTWAAAWHVREATTHGVDGAVAIADADPFVVSALREAGVPVLVLPIDNLDVTSAEEAARSMRAFADDLRDGRVGSYLRAGPVDR